MVDRTSGKPYVDERVNEYNIRTFSVNEDDAHYVWHRDNEDRLIEVLKGDGWQFQWEGCLPWLLVPGMKQQIRANEYHRIIKGANDLVIRITPLDK